MMLGRFVWIAIGAVAVCAASPAMALMINLPGTVAGGVEICTSAGHQCVQTPADAEMSVKVISYRDGEGEAIILYRGDRYIAQTNHVTVIFKGCNASLASYAQNKMCPGVRR